MEGGGERMMMGGKKKGEWKEREGGGGLGDLGSVLGRRVGLFAVAVLPEP